MAHTPAVSRLAWPDIARGISIIGVVTLHVSSDVPDGGATWLAYLNSYLSPLRLPLFFFISGYFSVKVLKFSFRELFCRRLWFLGVPYLVWGLVELLLSDWRYHVEWGNSIRPLWNMLFTLSIGATVTWFIHALIMFNIFLWLVRRLPAWLGFALTFIPLITLGFADTVFFAGNSWMFLPVFVAGALFRPYVTRFADIIDGFRRPTRHTALAFSGAIAAFAGGKLIQHLWRHRELEEMTIPWITPAEHQLSTSEIYLAIRAADQALELPLAIVIVVLLSHVPSLSRALRFVGRHTLALYLGHPIALKLAFIIPHLYFGWEISLHGQFPLHNTGFWLFACLAISAAGGLVLWTIERVPYLGWTMKPPEIGRTRPQSRG